MKKPKKYTRVDDELIGTGMFILAYLIVIVILVGFVAYELVRQL